MAHGLGPKPKEEDNTNKEGNDDDKDENEEGNDEDEEEEEEDNTNKDGNDDDEDENKEGNNWKVSTETEEEIISAARRCGEGEECLKITMSEHPVLIDAYNTMRPGVEGRVNLGTVKARQLEGLLLRFTFGKNSRRDWPVSEQLVGTSFGYTKRSFAN